MTKVYKEDFAYPVEAGKYTLAFAFPCPYAQRPAIGRLLLGLDEAVKLSVTSPIKTNKIWDFSQNAEGKDPILGVEYLSDIYLNTDPEFEGPYSSPALIDIEKKTVVNSESLDILKDFATRFKPLHNEGVPDLYPAGQEAEVEKWIQVAAKEVLGNASGAGYARDQETFDEKAKVYFDKLTELDKHLADKEYLLGDQLTAADIVMFTPLIRHDVLFMPVYGLMQASIRDYDNLYAYVKRLYNIPAFKESTDFRAYQVGQYLGRTGRIFFRREVVPTEYNAKHWEA